MNQQEWEALEKAARTMALGQYAAEASSIIKLTKEEITSIIKEAKVNQKHLSRLISIVNDTSKSNDQKAEVIKDIPELIKIVVPLITRLLF